MLRNYLKMALKVLSRRKFYTFISMFGICITLTILLVIYAFWEHALGAHSPESNTDRSLMVTKITSYKNEGSSYSSGMLSYYFLDRYVRNMKSPEKVSIHSSYSNVTSYVDSKRIDLALKYSDAEFWEVTDFTFIEGRPYFKHEVEEQQKVAVLNREVKEKIFGQASALGKEVELYKEKFKVIGVVKNTPQTRPYTYASIFVPYTLSKQDLKKQALMGPYLATILAGSPAQRKTIQQEFKAVMEQVENPDPDKIDDIYAFADPYLLTFSRPALGNELEGNDGTYYLVSLIMILLLLFMLIPTVNLMNINISRIMERSSEIGVRKSFGASSASLVIQFIFENLILTLICGFISIGLAFLALQAIMAANLFPYAELKINFNVFATGMFFTVVFGFLSGVYPAWRMSRLQAAEALKAS
jgi:putative ABC transport system permease protein